jgi:DNA-binding CsgD family transcriptional regulator
MKGPEAIDALSEKEREALRLLLAGHDAKSSARKLGVSHHAIHDRLRHARQKLGTTGSRQAALLLSEWERRTPDTVVHEPFGAEATAPSPDDPSSADLKRPGSSRSQRRMKGLVIMSICILAVAAAIAIGSQGDPLRKNAETAEAGTTAEQSAQARANSDTAARAFLALIDARDAEASYQAAAPTFREAHGFPLWELAVAIHASQGGAQRRTLVDVRRDVAPANPRHEALETLTFDTIMLNGERKTERLVMARIDGVWQLAQIDFEKVEGN